MGKVFKMPAGMHGGATFDGGDHPEFRYSLFRWWTYAGPLGWAHLKPKDKVLFICHNPSDAGAHFNDPTLRKVCKFANEWGYHGLIMHNLMDRIGDDPDDMRRFFIAGETIRSPRNLRNVLEAAEGCDKIICGWGKVHPTLLEFEREMLEALIDSKLYRLELNIDGSPKHPLYTLDDAKPKKWIPYGHN